MVIMPVVVDGQLWDRARLGSLRGWVLSQRDAALRCATQTQVGYQPSARERADALAYALAMTDVAEVLAEVIACYPAHPEMVA